MKTRLKPVYWENQKQCAAALGLDVRELKEWKADNCPAFRFSRIYHAELLDWIAKKSVATRRGFQPSGKLERAAPVCLFGRAEELAVTRKVDATMPKLRIRMSMD